jgi:hypothetical protein
MSQQVTKMGDDQRGGHLNHVEQGRRIKGENKN